MTTELIGSSPAFSGCFTVSVLDQADSPRRLASDHDDSDLSSSSYPYSTALDGIPGRAPSYAFHPRFTQLIVSRPGGGSASPLHQEDRNFTCTNVQVIQDRFVYLLSLSWSPSLVEPF